MISTRKGSPDGIQVNTYEMGKVYDLPSSLANVFLNEGWAKEEKVIDRATETKGNNNTSKRTSTKKKVRG